LISFDELVRSVKFETKSSGAVIVTEKDTNLQFVGAGRSAFVYRIKSLDKVIKIFIPSFAHLAEEEAAIYQDLQGTSYYSTLYQVGANYLVIDYIEGYTLFECLSKGIKIKEEYIKQADRALIIARERGLNPCDVHLRNIIITMEEEVKIIDVVRFRQSKDCTQWDDLKRAFYSFYRLSFFPKKIPVFILNFTAALYNKKLLSMLTASTQRLSKKKR
jgi:predicted Ser/Thr protein kinase